MTNLSMSVLRIFLLLSWAVQSSLDHSMVLSVLEGPEEDMTTMIDCSLGTFYRLSRAKIKPNGLQIKIKIIIEHNQYTRFKPRQNYIKHTHTIKY